MDTDPIIPSSNSKLLQFSLVRIFSVILFAALPFLGVAAGFTLAKYQEDQGVPDNNVGIKIAEMNSVDIGVENPIGSDKEKWLDVIPSEIEAVSFIDELGISYEIKSLAAHWTSRQTEVIPPWASYRGHLLVAADPTGSIKWLLSLDSGNYNQKIVTIDDKLIVIGIGPNPVLYIIEKSSGFIDQYIKLNRLSCVKCDGNNNRIDNLIDAEIDPETRSLILLGNQEHENANPTSIVAKYIIATSSEAWLYNSQETGQWLGYRKGLEWVIEVDTKFLEKDAVQILPATDDIFIFSREKSTDPKNLSKYNPKFYLEILNLELSDGKTKHFYEVQDLKLNSFNSVKAVDVNQILVEYTKSNFRLVPIY